MGKNFSPNHLPIYNKKTFFKNSILSIGNYPSLTCLVKKSSIFFTSNPKSQLPTPQIHP